jgi:ubiquitin C-terminal hydrolase
MCVFYLLNILVISNVIEIHQQIPSKYSKKPYHQAGVFSECQAQMEWKIVHMPGCGLINQDENGNCKNMCYINAIIQCFANTAPFVQWLLADRAIDKCK